jgi:hypothetical protein
MTQMTQIVGRDATGRRGEAAPVAKVNLRILRSLRLGF